MKTNSVVTAVNSNNPLILFEKTSFIAFFSSNSTTAPLKKNPLFLYQTLV